MDVKKRSLTLGISIKQPAAARGKTNITPARSFSKELTSGPRVIPRNNAPETQAARPKRQK